MSLHDQQRVFEIFELDAGELKTLPIKFDLSPPEDWEFDWEWVIEQTGFSLDDQMEIGTLVQEFKGHMQGSPVVVNASEGKYAIMNPATTIPGGIVVEIKDGGLPKEVMTKLLEMAEGKPGGVPILTVSGDELHLLTHKLAIEASIAGLCLAFPGISEQEIKNRMPPRNSAVSAAYAYRMDQIVHDFLKGIGMIDVTDQEESRGTVREPLNIADLKN